MLNRIGQWSPKQTSWLEEIINMNQLFLSVYWHPRIRGRECNRHTEKSFLKQNLARHMSDTLMQKPSKEKAPPATGPWHPFCAFRHLVSSFEVSSPPLAGATINRGK